MPRDEVMYWDESTPKDGKRSVWRPDRKDSSRVKDVVRKSSRSGDVMIDFCARACFKQKHACLVTSTEQLRGVVWTLCC